MKEESEMARSNRCSAASLLADSTSPAAATWWPRCLSNQVTRVQGPFSLRMFHRSWGLMLIQANIAAPCTLLAFPTRERFVEEIRGETYDIIGISAITPNIGKVKAMCELIRRHQPKAAIVVGGHIASLPNLRARIDADHIVRGEGVGWFGRFLGEDDRQPIRRPQMLAGYKRYKNHPARRIRERYAEDANTLPTVPCAGSDLRGAGLTRSEAASGLQSSSLIAVGMPRAPWITRRICGGSCPPLYTRLSALRSRRSFQPLLPTGKKLLPFHEVPSPGLFQALTNHRTDRLTSLLEHAARNARLLLGRKPPHKPLIQQPRLLLSFKEPKPLAHNLTRRGVAARIQQPLDQGVLLVRQRDVPTVLCWHTWSLEIARKGVKY
jgi:hypothetical protein